MKNIHLFSTILVTFLGMSFSLTTHGQASTVNWSEDFEGNWSTQWYADYGVWEVGTPAFFISSAYQGSNCLTTVLNGNYPDNADSRFIHIDPITIPSNSPRLRIWHWFYTYDLNDYGIIQVKPAGSTEWIDVSPRYYGNAGAWTSPLIDLSNYADQQVQLAFYFHSNQSYHAAGWFIDSITLVSGDYGLTNPETWEQGIGDWSAEYGLWETGTPTYGFNGAYNGLKCAGTVMNSMYPDNADSRLRSRPFLVPAGSDNPKLWFWHRYMTTDENDYGVVEVKDITSEDWVEVSNHFYNNSGAWTNYYVDLSAYKGSIIELCFRFRSNTSYHSAGWFIDDIQFTGFSPNVGIEERERDATSQLMVFPNPCTDQCELRYYLPEDELISLKLYDIAGRMNRTLVTANQSAGWHSVTLRGSELGRGVYLCRLTTQLSVATTRVIVR